MDSSRRHLVLRWSFSPFFCALCRFHFYNPHPFLLPQLSADLPQRPFRSSNVMPFAGDTAKMSFHSLILLIKTFTWPKCRPFPDTSPRSSPKHFSLWKGSRNCCVSLSLRRAAAAKPFYNLSDSSRTVWMGLMRWVIKGKVGGKTGRRWKWNGRFKVRCTLKKKRDGFDSRRPFVAVI